MVTARIDQNIINPVQEFVAEVKKNWHVDGVFLFGSFAKGAQHADSDIDIAIISRDFKEDRFDDMLQMRMLRTDLRIEPHAIRTEDFNHRATALSNEIALTGIAL